MRALVQSDPSVLSRNVRGRLKFNCRVDAAPSASEVESDGARLLVASTDDLLGLGCDARVREAAQTALRKLGLSRGEGTRAQGELEARALSLFGAEAALVVSHEEALLPLLPTWRLATEIRGRRTIPEAAQITTPEDAEAALGHSGMLGLILEAVHPLEGDLALTPRFAEACQRRHSNLLVIDDGLGVLGPTGGGAIEHLSLQEQVTLRILPLGGAIPGTGALVLGNAELLDTLRGALPAPSPVSLAASTRALDIAATEGARRARLFDVAQKLLTALKGRGFDTGPCVTPWIPVWLGDEALCERWLAGLAELGIACRGWLAGPRSRLLLAAPATLTDGQVGQIAEAFERLSRKLQVPDAGSLSREAPVLARPGSYAMGAPAALHWSTVDARERRPLEPELPHTTPPSSAENLTLRELVSDAVETLTWRATSVGGAQLRRSAEALRTLIDRRRR
jgi:7-keto-8-aminopelargonate synthetase-like enzyme